MKKTLLLFLLLPFFGFAQLNGNYVISSTKTDSQFKNLTEAIAKLNDVGIDGNVQFLLDENQNLTSQLVIKKFTNKKQNTVTIKPNDKKEIIISGKVREGGLITLNNADNIIIDGNNGVADNKLKIYNNLDDSNDKYAKRVAIWLYKKSENNKFQNLTIELNALAPEIGTISTGILASDDNFDNSANNANNTIQNVTFTNVKQAIVVKGQNKNNSGWKILNNKIVTMTNNVKAFLGISLLNVSDYTVTGNTLDGIKIPSNFDGTLSHSGIYLENADNGTVSNNTVSNMENLKSNGSAYAIYVKGSNAIISQNIVSNLFTTSTNTGAIGIKLEGDNGSIFNNKISSIITDKALTASGIYTTGNNQLIYNNFVLDVSSAGGGGVSGQNAFGIYIYDGNDVKLYHNSVKLITNQPSGCSSALYVRSGSGFDIRNNIFINAQTSGSERFAIYLESSDRSKFPTLDYNNYYSSQFVGTFGSYYTSTNKKTTLDEWKQATSKDASSKNENPLFVSNSLYLDASNSTNKILVGTPITIVPTDIDNNTRAKPYMGAHELIPCIPTQDPAVFGKNEWIGYVYKYQKDSAIPNIGYNETPNPTIATYVGTVTENAIFDRDVKSGAITGLTSNFPCEAAPSDFFLVRYKMRTKVTEAGLYNFAVGGDDAIRLYIDGKMVLERWGRGNYSINSTLFKLEANKDYDFVIDYFEVADDARTSFSFGLTKGDPTVFGEKVWNVYGYNGNDLTLQKTGYAGYYVDPNPNANSTAFWPTTKSPYAANNWQGAPMPNDYFTVVSKRRGFACGQYQIQVANQDDDLQIFVDGIEVFKKTGSTDTATLVNKGQIFTLNSKTEIEIRLKENAAAAKSSVIFINVPNNGNGSSLVITANTELNSDLTVCSCTINDGVTLTVKKDVTLTVDENINVLGEGKLLILDGGSLLQTSTSKDMFTGGSSKAFEIQRTTNVVRYDVTYWSSPVIGLSMHDLSPETLYDKFHYWNPSNNTWIPDNYGEKKMEAGNGYSIRAPQTYDLTTPKDFTAKFTGTPNNGNVPVPLVAGNLNLLGNPYPSSIDAEQFIRDNGDVGPLYFWSHDTPPKIIEGTNTFTYSSSDFAVFSLMGETQPSPKGQAPNGYIAAGQGFFVIPKVNSVLFTNEQRVKANNTSFYKTTEKASKIEKNRLWLNLTNSEGAFKQMLVGYATGATNSLDHNYDATTRGGNSYIDFYSISESRKLTIQGRALPFDNTDIVSLGYKSTIETNLTISIDHADGFFNTQEVYLEDKALGKIIDLRKENYTFKTAIGSNTTRFVLRYTNKTLGTDDFENLTDGILVAVKSKVINVASGSENIKEVKIFSIGGQLLYSKNKIEAKELEITNLYSSNQVLLVKVVLENDHVATKKIIFN
ncbi:T9SS sorting signal type C domain-containing protein [Flavobacterium sp. LPB0248]|uniref:T9SS sorting signal type C domain-containing protein n=1 Tax=Flavobacterium sp. LPB0248 TaxID=2614441 RepID=UPI0015A55471|nr:T9SS sorting signal type C domain-containing protein [Flavobacterium sp. LPB0248]QLC67033.1 T9SS sorting signal type C domain-containing protein [Flavobacterium sp. LPB0248]